MRKLTLTVAAVAVALTGILTGLGGSAGATTQTVVTAAAPVFRQATCTSNGLGSVTIPRVTGVVYFLDGWRPTPGTVQPLSTYPTVHEVMAAAANQFYVLRNGPTIRWHLTVVLPTGCGSC